MEEAGLKPEADRAKYSREETLKYPAYIRNLNGSLGADAVLDAKALAAIKSRTATSSCGLR